MERLATMPIRQRAVLYFFVANLRATQLHQKVTRHKDQTNDLQDARKSAGAGIPQS